MVVADRARKRRTGPAAAVGLFLVIIGGLGLLILPMIYMFSEGIPEPYRQSPGTYVAIVGAIAVACLAAGIGVVRSSEWGRWLGIAGLGISTLT
jgi:hypothetical protein